MQKLITSTLLGCFCLTANFSRAQTGTPTRVNAITTYTADSIGWFTSDSSYYIYSGSRGGYPVMSDGSLQYKGKYDALYYLAKGGRDRHYYMSARYISTFDSHNNILTNVIQSYDTSAHSWNNVRRFSYTYDASNNMLSNLTQNWNNSSGTWTNMTRFGNTYDASNNMVTDTSVSWVSGIMTYTALFRYTYDTHNNLINQLDYSYSSGSWDVVGRYSYFPNAGNKPDSVTYYSFSGTAWKSYYKNIYTYDIAYNELTDSGYLWNDTAWQNDNFTTNTYDIHNNQTSQLIQNWNGSGSTIAYNSFNANNMLDTMTLWIWNSGSKGKPVYQQVYYYGSATDVKNVNKEVGDMQLYPSPANSYMNIDIEWKTAQPARLAIYDMNGRLCRQWNADASLNYHTNIPTASMPAGNYILKVQGEAGQVARQFSVVH